MAHPLERVWKKERDKGVEMVLRDFWLEQGIEPGPEFERLKQEVELDIARARVEELSGEQFDERPWGVHALTEERPYVASTIGGGRPPQPDFVTPDGIELWIRTANTRRYFVTDFPPEWAQSELEREFGDDTEFVTVYDGGNTEYLADSGGTEPSVWRRVREFGLGEHECPFATWDPEAHGEVRKNVVKESDTWYGEHPGKWCRLCEAAIGEEHGYIYLGEDAQEVVYMRLKPPQELSTVDTEDVEQAVLTAFHASGLVEDDNDSVEAFFERGHWWVRADVLIDERSDNDRITRTYSVVDTADADFDFEEV